MDITFPIEKERNHNFIITYDHNYKLNVIEQQQQHQQQIYDPKVQQPMRIRFRVAI